MNWIYNLFFAESVAHSIILIALVITIGILLGKIKIAGISLGITWILFVGIILSHFGMRIDDHTLHFIKEFGLILFVYSVGLQVGPSFFSSFKKGGITLNMLATSIVLLGVLTTYVIHIITGTSLVTMVGILSGAVTNTPGLGAAQQTYSDLNGSTDPSIALGYAVAYPLGVIGIITSTILIKYMFRIKLDKENESIQNQNRVVTKAEQLTVEVHNNAIFSKTIAEITELIDKLFVVSRIYRPDGRMEVVSPDTVVNQGDRLLIITPQKNQNSIVALIGNKVDMAFDEWQRLGQNVTFKKIIITKAELNGKHISSLKLRSLLGVTITRVNRAGVDLIATDELQLQIGDRVTVVGNEDALQKVEKMMGNSLKKLREPNLIAIFLGICLGVLLGSIPFMIPGIPQPVKLGLAGGPLIVSILISRFGPNYKLITYTTASANMMLREIGIALFLAAVGLGAGAGFIDTIVYQGGYNWILYGVIITILPLLIVGFIGRKFLKINYFTLMGLIAGSTTDPPALAYSNATAGNDIPAVAYATVYPLTMFLRVLTAQIMLLFALG